MGTPWPLQIGYACSLVLAAPGLTCLADETGWERARDKVTAPIIGSCLRKCSSFFEQKSALLYIYVTTILSAADQMLDNNTAALAKACDYDRWSWMVAAYALSILLQAGACFLILLRG